VSDAFLTEAITGGRSGSTMSAWGVSHGGPLAPKDVEAVVSYLRSWQSDLDSHVDDHPAKGDVANGEKLYMVECQQCHADHGKGIPYEGIGNGTLLRTASDGFLRAAIALGRSGTPMPAFKDKLGDTGIDDILTALRSWQKATPEANVKSAPAARPPPLPLGPVPLNPRGHDPAGFEGVYTKADVVHAELAKGAKMAILDARAPSDYTHEHIAGAVSVPFYDPSPYVSQLPHDAYLVAYCGCPHAESSQLAQKLRTAGFTKVTVIDEGLRYWTSKKYGTHEGTQP
jgi:cytochrome c oxidase cbb3-type subunit III